MQVETLVVGNLGTNCYLAYDNDAARGLLIDPGDEAERILARVADLGIAIELVVLTHFHFDHVLAAGAVSAGLDVPIAIHEADAPLLERPPALFRLLGPGSPSLQAERLLKEGDEIPGGASSLRVLHTPGHSPGGISLWGEADGVVFTGDALFAGGIGRTDFPGSSHADLVRGIRTHLLALPDDTVVYPGHGPTSTIGAERKSNPWLSG